MNVRLFQFDNGAELWFGSRFVTLFPTFTPGDASQCAQLRWLGFAFNFVD